MTALCQGGRRSFSRAFYVSRRARGSTKMRLVGELVGAGGETAFDPASGRFLAAVVFYHR